MRLFIFIFILLCAGLNLPAQEPEYFPPAVKYKLDTSWSRVIDYTMAGEYDNLRSFSYLGNSDIRLYISNEIIEGEAISQQAMAKEIEDFAIQNNFPYTTTQHGAFTLVKYAKKEKSELSGKIEETQLRYNAFTTYQGYYVFVMMWVPKEFEYLGDILIKEALSNIHTCSTMEIDQFFELPLTQEKADSLVLSKVGLYEHQMKNYIKNAPIEELYALINQTNEEKPTELQLEKFVQDSAIWLPKLNEKFNHELDQIKFQTINEVYGQLQNQFSFTKFYGLKRKYLAGEFPLNEYLEFQFTDQTHGELDQLYWMASGQLPQAQNAFNNAILSNVFKNNFNAIQETDHAEVYNKSGNFVTSLFLLQQGNEIQLKTIQFQLLDSIWKYTITDVGTVPEPGYFLYSDNKDTTHNFILIQTDAHDAFIGTKEFNNDSFLPIKYKSDKDSLFKLIYSNISHYNDTLTHEFVGYGKELYESKAIKSIAPLIPFDSIYAPDHQAKFYQSLEYRMHIQKMERYNDSLLAVEETVLKGLKSGIEPSQRLYVSGITFEDINGDQKKEAFWIAVSNGKIIDFQCFTTSKINIIQIPANGLEAKLKQTKMFKLMSEKSQLPSEKNW